MRSFLRVSFLATILLCGLFVVSTYAGMPQLISYQGRLTTPSGTPVADGAYTVVFTIYDAPTGGVAKWTETQTLTATNGLVSTMLGYMNGLYGTTFVGGSRYLGVKVNSDPELTPRQILASVPWAYRVSTIDSAAGGSVIGNINLENSTASSGNILKADTLFLHNYGALNTFVGANAGNVTLTGAGNTGNGCRTLQSISSGNYNTADGYQALRSNTTAWNNTAIGANALVASTVGNANTAVGSAALSNNINGHSNTASGYQSLYYNSAGFGNTAAGLEALYNNRTGGSNTADGRNALHNNDDGNYNTACGNSALSLNNTGDYNTACGAQALSGSMIGNYNTAVGYWADISNPDLTNATAIGARAVVNASNKIRLGDTLVTVIEGKVAYTFTSDRNEKENFQSIDGTDVLSKIRAMNLTSWNYKNQDPAKFRHYGPVAQDFFAAFGHDGVGQCGDSVTINSGDQAGILMIAVQALERRTAEIEQVKAENAELKARLEQLEAKLQRLSHE